MSDDQLSREDEREPLWKTYVEQYADPEIYRANRIGAAINVLQAWQHFHADADGDQDKQLTALTNGFAVFSLIASEIAPWLVNEVQAVHGFNEPPTGQMASLLLQALTTFTDQSLFPTRRAAFDPAVLVMPRALMVELQAALAALREGEVRPLFQPSDTGRHGEAWTWAQARLRAVQYVLFLNGQGVAKRVAQARMGNAAGVGGETLRKWEGDLKISNAYELEQAKKAGALFIKLQDDPEHGMRGDSINAHDYSLMCELQSEELGAFGRAYKEAFGSRHNS